MGVYTEYLNRNMSFEDLTVERKNQLRRISTLRDRDVLVYAADLSPNPLKAQSPTGINYADLLPLNDQVSNLTGTAVDLILETPGGYGEVAEDIVRLLHGKFSELGVIVPGYAKSAGTILAMAGEEILMEASSALGPIDAQLNWQGRSFSADALLEGFEKIKKEVVDTNNLNKAYIPILQGLSPGEIQTAENALKFAKERVTEWLANYKFKNWTTHAKSGNPVTDAEKRELSERVANSLCDHRRWLTHARSIKIADLEEMELKITDYSKVTDLADAIRRYHVLLQMTFNSTNIYKVFETVDAQIYLFAGVAAGGPNPAQLPPQAMQDAELADLDFTCGRCQTKSRIQANFGTSKPIRPGFIPFPANNILKCPGCGSVNDLTNLRRQFESQTRKRIVP